MKEVWKDVPGFEGFYQASSLGRVRSVDRIKSTVSRSGNPMQKAWKGKILSTPTLGKKSNYLVVKLSKLGVGKQWLVHTVILLTFVGPRPDGMECRHLNGNPRDNRAKNLRWGTPIENASDQELHGRTTRGWKVAAGNTATWKRQAIVDLHEQCGYDIPLLAKVFDKPELTVRYLIGLHKDKTGTWGGKPSAQGH